MKKLFVIVFVSTVLIFAETLFEVKDASNNKVLDVSTDGLRIMNMGDTVMVISSNEIKANLQSSKGLSRSFSVATSTSKGAANSIMWLTPDSTRFGIKETGSGFGVSTYNPAGKGLLTNVLHVNTLSTEMREGSMGHKYTDFSPENIFLGLNAGSVTTPNSPYTGDGTLNLFFGNNCGKSNTTGSYNIMMGDNCGKSNTSGGNNLFIGNNSGELNTTGGWNLFIGNGSGAKNTATNNMFMGHNSGASNTSGEANLFVGTDAGAYNTGGIGNVFVGQQTGIYNTNGDNNTFIGRWAGNSNQNYSDDNTFTGFSAGMSQTAGNQNTYIGSLSGKEKTTGYYNTFLGYGSGQKNGTGTSNTMLGYMSGWTNTGSSNVFIGMQAGYNESGSNKLYIANTNTNTPLIYGDFSTNNIGFGTNAPGSNRLKVVNSGSGITGAAGYFENTNTAGIGLAVFATSTDVALYAEQKNSTSATANIAKFASAYGGWSEKVVFRSTGSVLMPYLAAGSGTDLYITSGGEVVKFNSSRKYKKDIAPLSIDITNFMKLQPVSFKWNEKSATENKADYGLIAEEVEKIDKELAVYNQDWEIEGVDYQKINIMLLKVVQDQQKKIEELEKRLERVERQK